MYLLLAVFQLTKATNMPGLFHFSCLEWHGKCHKYFGSVTFTTVRYLNILFLSSVNVLLLMAIHYHGKLFMMMAMKFYLKKKYSVNDFCKEFLPL